MCKVYVIRICFLWMEDRSCSSAVNILLAFWAGPPPVPYTSDLISAAFLRNCFLSSLNLLRRLSAPLSMFPSLWKSSATFFHALFFSLFANDYDRQWSKCRSNMYFSFSHFLRVFKERWMKEGILFFLDCQGRL